MIIKTKKINLKKESYRTNKFNSTRKKKNISNLALQPINQFRKNIYVENTESEFRENFLSSCFKYYYGNIKICNKHKQLSTSSCKSIGLTNSFLQVINNGPLIIIDYPNIIHILYEKYKDKNKVIREFYEFIYRGLNTSNTKFYIISKNVIIDDIPFDIKTVFNQGSILTGKIIDKKYFDHEHINIYDLNYKIKISSSIDDLLGYFICFVLFVYLSKSGIDPNKKERNNLKKLTILTNDKQFFNKNLFGLTEEEQKNHIQISKDLIVNKLIPILDPNHEIKKYVFKGDNLEGELIRSFLNEYISTTVKDTKNLECKMIVLLEIMNHHLVYICKNNSCSTIFSYDEMNGIMKKVFKKYEKKYNDKPGCKGLNKLVNKKRELIHYYYLYFFIKYIQMYLHWNNNYDKKNIFENNSSNFYSSYSKEEIIKLLNNE